jgi:AAA+ ATPase superfamily predicted ATPase
MMRNELISPKGSLYGRTTADLLLDDISPEEIKRFLPKYGPEQIVETFSILGGVPKYLELWDDSKTVVKNIEELILSPVTIFRQEPVFLIQDEIADVRTYLAVLEAIGSGMRPQKTIAEHAGIALPNISKYLNVLSNLGFIRRIISIDAPDINNTRMSSYEIRDSYLRFYFTYIQPNISLLEQNRNQMVLEIVKDSFSSFVSRNGFEELCRRFIISRGDSGNLPFMPYYVGRIWNRNVEIDIAALDAKKKNVLLGECKWKNTKISESNYYELKEKSKKIAHLSGYTITYAMFSKAGFTKEMIQLGKKENVMLFEGASFEEK